MRRFNDVRYRPCTQRHPMINREREDQIIRRHLEQDLQIHQIELEMQNQELKAAQRELETSRDRYATLYDFSPIGFITVDRHGMIMELNLAAAALIGMERTKLVKKRLCRFLNNDEQSTFSAFVHRCRQSQTPVTQEFHMAPRHGRPGRVLELHGHNIPNAFQESDTCQLAIIDITDRRQAEEACHALCDQLDARVRERTDALLKANQTLAETNRQLKELSSHLQQVREEERKRIAREIHDELGGLLTAIKYDLCTDRSHRVNEVCAGAERFPTAVTLVDSAIHSLRRIITNLRPSILDEVGLWAALEWQAHEFQEQTGIPCTFNLCGPEQELDSDRATAVFRIIQEALTNIARHANAQHVQMEARVTGTEIAIRVMDDGKGITRDQTWNCESFGIRGMQERAQAFNFSVRILPNRNKGTMVVLKLPRCASSTQAKSTTRHQPRP